MNLYDPSQAILSIFQTACGVERRMPTKDDLPAPGDSVKAAANRMEGFWIRALHDAFQSYYDAHPHPGVVVLSKARFDSGWNRNEFMHDLTVLRRHNVLSAYLKRPLPVADRIIWQVESELSGNGRDVAIDFSKLVAGSAESKLLIVRRPMEWQVNAQERVRRFVENMAGACCGDLFLAFVPAYASTHGHLKAYWEANNPLPYDLFFRHQDGRFKPLSG